MINLKNHIYVILSERLLLFSINSFADELTLSVLDYLYEWGLLKDGKIKQNIRVLNDLLINTINKSNDNLKKLCEEKNMKLVFFEFDVDLGDFSEYLENPEKFSAKVYSYCTKIFCKNKLIPILNMKLCENFIEYDGMPCLGLTGEQKEIILKTIKY